MMMHSYSKPVYEAVKKHLEAHGCTLFCNDSTGEIRFLIHLPFGPINSYEYSFQIQEDCVILYAYFPVRPDRENRDRMNALCCKINRSLKNGSVQPSLMEGLSFRAFIDCSDSVPTEGALRNAVSAAFSTMNDFSEELLAACMGSPSPVKESPLDLLEHLDDIHDRLAHLHSEEAEDSAPALEDAGNDAEEDSLGSTLQMLKDLHEHLVRSGIADETDSDNDIADSDVLSQLGFAAPEAAVFDADADSAEETDTSNAGDTPDEK